MANFLKLRKYQIGMVLVALLLIALVSYKTSFADDKSMKLDFTKVKRDDFSLSISVSGVVEAEKQIEIRFQTSGRLAWVGVKEGDQVKKWQALASLDKRELEKKLKKQLNGYMNERWDFEQTDDDYEGQVLTDEIRRILDKAQFDLENKVIDVELADLTLKYATIVSPISGIVTEIKAPVAGVNITPATAAITIVDPNSVVFKMKIDEADVAAIKADQSAKISFDAYPEQTFSQTIKKISFNPVSGSSGTAYGATVNLPDNSNLRFRLGMNGEGEIIVQEEKNVLIVSENAIAKRGDEYYVFVAENNHLKKKIVELGLWGDDEVVVVSGLQEGDRVLSSQISKVKDGQKI